MGWLNPPHQNMGAKTMTTVFLVIVEDRHTEASVEVFASRAGAIARAVHIVSEYDYEPDEPDEPIAGWIFHATLSREGDYVRVEASDVVESPATKHGA